MAIRTQAGCMTFYFLTLTLCVFLDVRFVMILCDFVLFPLNKFKTCALLLVKFFLH